MLSAHRVVLLYPFIQCRRKHYCSHFADEETEAWGILLTRPAIKLSNQESGALAGSPTHHTTLLSSQRSLGTHIHLPPSCSPCPGHSRAAVQRGCSKPLPPRRSPAVGRARPPQKGWQRATQEILTAPAGPGGSSERILSQGSRLLLDSSLKQGWAASSLWSIRLF